MFKKSSIFFNLPSLSLISTIFFIASVPTFFIEDNEYLIPNSQEGISSIINSGDLVSDEIVSKLIEKYISDQKNKQRLIFDGYPRNIDQAKNLDKLLKKYNQQIDIVLKLSVSLETIKKRITERKSQEQRTDDSDEIAVKRFKTYELSSEPVLDYYKQSNLLKVINGENTISEINVEISGLIDAIKG